MHNIDNLTIGQLREALEKTERDEKNQDCCVAPAPPPVTTSIVVLDRGFVYVGNISFSEDHQFLTVTNCRNIRVWGTTKGLGELAQNGPNSKTVLDFVGEILVPVRAVIHILTCKTNW